MIGFGARLGILGVERGLFFEFDLLSAELDALFENPGLLNK